MNVTIYVLLFLSLSQNIFSQWILQPLPVASGKLMAIDFSDLNHGITCGGFIDFSKHTRAFYTTNRGYTWLPASFPDSSKFFYSISFVDTLSAYMCGEYRHIEHPRNNSNKAEGFEPGAFFLKSINSGKDWSAQGSSDLLIYNKMEAIDFIDLQYGIAIVTKSNSEEEYSEDIIITTDSAMSWDLSFSANDTLSIDFVSLDYINTNFVYTAGNHHKGNTNDGIILKSTDGGRSWGIKKIENLIINNISFLTPRTGFICGSDPVNSFSVLYKTTDEGLNWDLIQTFGEDYYNGVAFLRESGVGLLYGYNVNFGEPPVILRTTNQGSSWIRQFLPQTNDTKLTDAAILSPDRMYVAGGEFFSGGLVLYTSTGGATFINNQNVYSERINFQLFQNYPNPFNPSTKIAFEIIPADGQLVSKVKLNIYDMLSKEVSVLINETLFPGSYEAEFNAGNFSAGIYFYKLEVQNTSANFTEIKKMVLIK